MDKLNDHQLKCFSQCPFKIDGKIKSRCDNAADRFMLFNPIIFRRVINFVLSFSEDVLVKVSPNKRLTDRRVFLFDGLMILCKPNSRRQSSAHQNPEYRLKERFFIRKVEIIDHQDTEDLRNAFEISPRQMQPSVILCAKTPEEKNSWMADLVMLNNR